jgi:hypothetical protein
MADNLFHLVINNISVGTWLQTLVFYFILFALAHIILVQLDIPIIKWGAAGRRSAD